MRPTTLAQQVAHDVAPLSRVRCRSSDQLHHLDDDARKSKEAKSVKYRILFLCLMILSSRWPWCSAFVPRHSWCMGCHGKQKRHNAKGFFSQFGNIVSFYIVVLALYYYKSLCCNMNDEQIAKRYEKWIHIGPLWSGNCNSGLAAGLVLFHCYGVLDGSRAVFDTTEETVLIVHEVRMHTYTSGCTRGFLMSLFVCILRARCG
jgi:hypothetical protein